VLYVEMLISDGTEVIAESYFNAERSMAIVLVDSSALNAANASQSNGTY